MIYSNDESDKSIRQKNYYLTVYLYPLTAAFITCGAIYFLSSENIISRQDRYYGYFLSVCVAVIVYGLNRRYWLKMPDGSFQNIKGIDQANHSDREEPNEYDEEYFESKGKKISWILSGIVIVGMGIFITVRGQQYLLIPIVTILMGVFLTYRGIVGLTDHTAKLKLARLGLWTKKLGFRDWNEITKAQVIEEHSGKTPQFILEIYLKETVFAEAGKPDERLYLTNLENYQYVEMVIENFIIKRNEKPV